ncbi:MAG: MmcQ/YjbR family DNA-binding protein [Cyclobacteriaceae bacterium]|nr:MmcQ/YjbR family DNA-binding protein [Cyclobacteriaceae bacterium]
MNIEEYRNYCLKKPGVTEEFPFNETALVFKVMGKMFALINVEKFEIISLKCDPEKGAELREQYSGINYAYHFNKKHWIGVATDGSVPEQLMYDLINHSYELVVNKLSKIAKEELAEGDK